MNIVSEFFTTVYDWTKILQYAVVSFSVVFILVPAEKNRKGFWKPVVCFFCLFAAETLVNLALYALASVWTFLRGLHFVLAHLIIITVFTVFFCRYKPMNRIVLSSTIFITVVVLVEFGQSLADYFTGISFREIFYILADALTVLLTVVIRFCSMKDFEEIPQGSMALVLVDSAVEFLVLAATITMTGDLIAEFSEETYRMILILRIFLYGALFLNSIVTYLIMYLHSREYRNRVAADIENAQLRTNEQVFLVTDQAVEEMREFRHDMNNQLSVLRTMLKEEKYGEMNEYLSSMNIGENAQIRFADSGNSTIDSIINSEILKAQQKGIRILTVINVPEKLPFESADLGKILCNLLDNAIEATERENSGDRDVGAQVAVRGGYLYIRVTNPAPENRSGAGENLVSGTVKEEKSSHGYGHRIVERMVKKYGGQIDYSMSGGEFTADAILAMGTERTG